MQQQPADNEESPIWAIDLFERRQFRNGSVEAQCMECGKRFIPMEVNTMTGHIVQEHPQYAAKLLAKQLEFGGHQRMPKEEESPIGPCSTSTTVFAAERQQQAILADANAGAKQMSLTLSSSMPKDGLSLDRSSAIAPSPFRPLSPATPEATTNQAAAGNCLGAAARFAFAADDAIGMAPISMVKDEEQPEVGLTVHYHHDETNRRQFDTDMEMRDVSVTTNDTFSSTTTGTMTTGKTTFGGGGDNKAYYVDRFGKEWRLFVFAVDPELLDNFVRQNMLCRSGPPKHDGRIYYSCRWSGRWSPYQNCLHRALYLPGRKALVYRRTHNHPTPISALNANNSGILTVPMAAAQQQHENNGSNNDDNVSAFSAALPDIDNLDNAITTDSKEHVVVAVAVTTATEAISDNRPPPHMDPFGKQWDWLLDLPDVGDKEKIRQFCHTHFLSKSSNYPRRILYVCKLNKRHSLRDFVRCPYRALYVAERGAVFAYTSHNHAPVEDKKCVGTNDTMNSSGISDSIDLRRRDANSSNSTATKNGSQSSFVSNKSMLHHNIKTKQHIDNNNTAQSDTYVAGNGRVWTRLATLDEADGDCTAARQQLRVLGELHRLCRYSLRRNRDGTFHTVGLACSEWRKFHCPYRAIYVVKLRAVFHWSSHDHTTKKPKPTPKLKKILTNKKSGKKMTIKRTKKKAIKRAKNKVVKVKGEPKRHIVRTSTLAPTDANQYLSISKFSSSDHKAPVIIDRFKNLWHWLADLADDSGGVVLDFCRQYYVNKQFITVDEKRVFYWCRYRKAPISCPYKLQRGDEPLYPTAKEGEKTKNNGDHQCCWPHRKQKGGGRASC
uniref:Uncharacterized protein n=1 Tax=Globodera rostochiensis TaxID=31243 RepID=A0A914I0T9_GLORO